MTYAPGWDCDMHCVRSSAHLRLRTRAHKLVFTPRIVIETNSPAHAESSPHVRRTLDINRESDIHAVAGTLQTPISIHALREENDPGTLRLTKRSKNFNPHSPCGERRHQHLQRARTQDFNPHSPCGERLGATRTIRRQIYFNPHSPCGERRHESLERTRQQISIHTPLAGSDFHGKVKSAISAVFQSTLPLRGATKISQGTYTSCVISIHTPLAGSDATSDHHADLVAISIHTPLAGSDYPFFR